MSPYTVYVCENFARHLYAGLNDNEDGSGRLPLDEVRLTERPRGDFDKCGFYNTDVPDGDDPEEIAYMSSIIQNATMFLN